jgi:hypothetical protein
MSFDVKEGYIGDSLGMKEAGIFADDMFPHGMLNLCIDATQVR